MSAILESAEAVVQQTMSKAMTQVSPKFGTITDIAITYQEGGSWHKVDVDMHDFLKILQTGEFEERKVCAVRVLDIACNNEDEDVVSFVYDFTLLHTERNPWRMI